VSSALNLTSAFQIMIRKLWLDYGGLLVIF